MASPVVTVITSIVERNLASSDEEIILVLDVETTVE